ncbi:FKBP-type peptidyl-prolyl cis-trans isomerase [Saccharicrinis sp. FJH62]|uniref:FKBP-type peptidyl-prolyl cis-trans isomerase n=1 Tax=Saccharicrinis sp. FJH62 TaxID=3344657 RepID=UPI0035D45A26
MNRSLIYFVVLLLIFSGCKNKPRQSSRELQQIETSRERYMLEWNKKMAEQQDSLFVAIADTSVLEWVKSDNGYYYSISGSENGAQIMTDDVVSMNYILKTILNIPIDTYKVRYVAGKSQDIPSGIQNCVLKMRENQKATLMLPFNLAYGVKGIPGKVAPFQPLRVEITIEKVEKR